MHGLIVVNFNYEQVKIVFRYNGRPFYLSMLDFTNKFSQARPSSRNSQKLHPAEISDTMVYVITRLLGILKFKSLVCIGSRHMISLCQ